MLSNLPTCMREGMVREDLMTSPVGVVLCLASTLTAWQCNFTCILRGIVALLPLSQLEGMRSFPWSLSLVTAARGRQLLLFASWTCFLHTSTFRPRISPFAPFFFPQYLPNVPTRIENQTDFIAPSCYRPLSRPWPPLSRPAICGPVSWPPPAA